MWRSYLDYLHDWVGDSAARSDAVVAAARASFAALEQWLAPVAAAAR
jgi:heme oxygenase